ncbi:alpha/beta fold hydrolase [Variovorax sp. J22G73]|jgi:alpha-beta hydrolase superfamily lysophospholipase|uniref:alpha/beta hydrolase family protein n=1 Tax=unclassified Variovorax TaxID=663243 RepID=UPI000D5DD0E7|nr:MULTISPECIES: alpha/beta hydrolase [unclassified Variovorax]MDM0003435.1 alpha/beta fold hydrolase [Variovorax sp. J22R203]MDM0096899.1 alpha/beta fold hydrolase [Variovorax sp. J22G73]
MERRQFARSLLAATGALALGARAAEEASGSSLPPAAQAAPASASAPAAASPTLKPFVFEQDETFWFETLRSFGHIAYGGADFGEVLATAQRIRSGDYDSWHDEWKLTADRVAAEAQKSQDGGHAVSARDAFLRASNYYRSAEFFLHGNPGDPRIASAYDRSVQSFRAAARLTGGAVEPVRIRYEGTSLPGYFYRAAGQGQGKATGKSTARRRPTVVMHNGFDGSVEEMHYVAAVALAERGYNVLSFDGPGQPGPMHREGLVLRPDWEHVVGPVLDHVLARPDVDARRVALLGNSLGGVLAPRAAAFEPRIRALVALDGIYDMGLKTLPMFGGQREVARRVLTAPSAPDIDKALAQMAAHDSQARWAFSHGAWVTGKGTARGYLSTLLDYHVADGIAERIQCPTLVCAASNDMFFKGQPEMLHAHLTCPKTFMALDDTLGAGAHCHVGAQRLAMARIGDWLDTTFA